MASLNTFTQAEINRMINNTAIFAGTNIHEQNLLANRWEQEDWNADEVVIKEGEIGDRLYLILRGSVLISKVVPFKGRMKITTLHAGDVFGEIAILRSIPRTADVTTLTPCSFLTIDAKNFITIYQYFSPASKDNIQLIIEKRLKQQRWAGKP